MHSLVRVALLNYKGCIMVIGDTVSLPFSFSVLGFLSSSINLFVYGRRGAATSMHVCKSDVLLLR